MQNDHSNKDQPSYLSSFQQGYKLRQYSPEVFELLRPSLDPTVSWHQALLDGAKQYEAEKNKEQGKVDEISDIRKNKDKQQDLEK